MPNFLREKSLDLHRFENNFREKRRKKRKRKVISLQTRKGYADLVPDDGMKCVVMEQMEQWTEVGGGEKWIYGNIDLWKIWTFIFKYERWACNVLSGPHLLIVQCSAVQCSAVQCSAVYTPSPKLVERHRREDWEMTKGHLEAQDEVRGRG
jgi:hypothetical protein